MAQPDHLNRKRSRSTYDEENCDFMPLSKRINNLHIDRSSINNSNPNGVILHSHDQQNQHDHHQGTSNNLWNNQNGINHHINGNHHMNGNEHHHIQNSTNNWQQQQHEMLPEYAPVLEPSENPHYYQSNKFLFDLHIERLRRSNINE